MPTLDFSADQAVFDNTEDVTFASVRTAGNVSGAVAGVGYYPQAVGEGAPSYGVYTKGLAKFSVPVRAAEGFGGVKPRDTITLPDGTAYTVLDAQKGPLSGVWQVNAVNLALAADLAQTGVLTRHTAAKNSAYRSTNAATTTIGTVACRVQPEGGAATDVFDRRTIPKRFTAYLASALNAQAKDVFTVSGTEYSVIEERNSERIDELPVLVLEQIT